MINCTYYKNSGVKIQGDESQNQRDEETANFVL